eukprot:gnl/TRDRNA2_/TRDRNA2_172868_c6_seq16.p1 gnl/TRDRNA2_/TRDRNA2_172868_c6~~gnl/TRDRNA2_/TRDRNA2_172868_c6_seq16.p1  ORF type:complete len:848 (+),score=129.15 gnl/TRDRNA2_/TRDRNA2_172868_c6_seq16:20-2563(+)
MTTPLLLDVRTIFLCKVFGSFTAILLLTLTAQSTAKLLARHASTKHGSVDCVPAPTDKLVLRACMAELLRHADLEETTVGKPGSLHLSAVSQLPTFKNNLRVAPFRPFWWSSKSETKGKNHRSYVRIRAKDAAALAAEREDWLFFTVPETPRQGARATLYFNQRKSDALRESSKVQLLCSFNDWELRGISMDMHHARIPHDEKAVWWMGHIDIPQDAYEMNFVLTDGEQHFDNNNQQNYHKGLSGGYTWEMWQQGRVLQRYSSVVKRRQMYHLVATEPEVPKAGEDFTVFYNAAVGGLGHASEVFLKGGFNRWSHPDAVDFLKMELVTFDDGQRWAATIRSPPDVYSFDFVLSDGHGPEAAYDNHGSIDYHVPIVGKAKSPRLYVVHISVEMAPIAKVGGLGDVVTALARSVQERGHLVEIILPWHEFFKDSPLLGDIEFEMEYEWGASTQWVKTCIVEGVRVFFIQPSNGMFNLGNRLYDDLWTDGERFDFFSKAALEFLLQSQRQPDILHCHDWSTAEVARAYWHDYHDYGLWKPKVVFTIHNLDYGTDRLALGAENCQRLTTVSASYAAEISDSPVVSANVGKLVGIRNGIDTKIWNPANDQFLPCGFTHERVAEGKAAARQALQERLSLRQDIDRPMIGVVSRLTPQKGVHLIKHCAHLVLERGCQFVLLGSAPDPEIQADFNQLAESLGKQHHGMASFVFAYDEPLSHLIYAGSDMIVMPSMFEPCGLAQLIAMRYGAVPVVRSTGGLRDTVFDVQTDRGKAAWEVHGWSDPDMPGMDGTNGFTFEGTDEGSLDYALNRAIDSWYDDRSWFHGLQGRVAAQDWSWDRPAEDYIELYYNVISH